ncbi:hypothetical protein KO516_22665 [Citreicella sp. C3M06]|uniref:BtpA/SgcQ family protein n=1 Tax=Citreicella sp. C3M06 TaxID=2841564 RepID=UPI001C086817|nr:BtpA/SgcQ family protein [Citreicella sp. C3M06]MBU2963579.1 hypothetical protein [Citreicella sp. C3M06]
MTTQPATCMRCLQKVVDPARQDLLKLQHGGVDAPVVSSAFSLPFLTTVKPVTTAAMARIVGVYAGGFGL